MLPLILEVKDNIADAVQSIITNRYTNASLVDVKEYGKDGTISIDEIRDIAIQTSQSAAIQRVFVLYEFEKAKNEAQNAMLKTLEEHNANADFILQTSNLLSILPTVISRCQIMRVRTSQKEEKSKPAHNELFFSNSNAVLLLRKLMDYKKDDLIGVGYELSSGLHSKIKELVNSNNYEDIDVLKKQYTCLQNITIVESQLKNNIYPEFAVDYMVLLLEEYDCIRLMETDA